MLHVGDSLVEFEIRKQAVASPEARGLSYPVAGGPPQARPGAMVVAYRNLMVRLGERLELLGTEMQARYLIEQQADPCAG